MKIKLIRDDRLDTLRGLMLVMITINHMGSWFSIITYQPFGFFSAAEGFVFLSGLVAGLVYANNYQADSYQLWQRALRRARDIYVIHMLLIIGLVLVGVLIQDWLVAHKVLKPFWYSLLREPPELTIFLYGTFLFHSSFLDILPMYALFLLLVPVVVSQLMQDRYWLVFTVSVGLWLSVQWGVRSEDIVSTVSHGWLYLQTCGFEFLAWQLLFVMGIMIGVWRVRYPTVSPTPARFELWLLCLVIMLVLGCAQSSYKWLFRPDVLTWLPDSVVLARDWLLTVNWRSMSQNKYISPLRLLNFIVVVYLIARLGARYPQWLTNRWLAWLGQHSLQVFAWHIVLMFSLTPLGFGAAAWSKGRLAVSWEWNIVITVLVVASLSIPAWLHGHYRQRQKAKKQSLACHKTTVADSFS